MSSRRSRYNRSDVQHARATNLSEYSGYAGFWRRFVAALIDWILLMVLSGIAGSFIGVMVVGLGIGMGMENPSSLSPVDSMTGGPVGIIISWLYYALFECSGYQATPGKRAIGLRVTDLDEQSISFGRATARYFGKFLSTLILFIGYLMAGWTAKKQALHDIIAGCLVVKE